MKNEPWKKFYRILRLGEDDAVDVYVVDGMYVRDHLYVDYVEGGHGYVYDWIPKDEIWVEKLADNRDMWFNLQHEIYERNLMKNEGMDYEKAHGITAKREEKQRHKFINKEKKMKKMENVKEESVGQKLVRLIKDCRAKGINCQEASKRIRMEFRGQKLNPAFIDKSVRRAYVMNEATVRTNRLGSPSAKPAQMMDQFVNELKKQEEDRLPTYSYAQPMQTNPKAQRRKPSVRGIGFMNGM
jgi:hypothetical protein